jgi:hypothetical protein
VGRTEATVSVLMMMVVGVAAILDQVMDLVE